MSIFSGLVPVLGHRRARDSSRGACGDSPVVRLNGAVAVGEADGLPACLAALAALDAPLAGTPRWRRTSHERDGDSATVARLHAEAARKARTLAGRRYPTRQAARLNTRRCH